MSIKRDILNRLNVVFVLLCGAAALIIIQAFIIQTVEGAYWREQSMVSTRIDTIEGERGNIYSEDGRLIATSLPFFEIRMDTRVMPDSVFNAEIDSFALLLARYLNNNNETGDTTAAGCKKKLLSERKANNRYLLIDKDASYNTLEKIKNWPLFRYGKYKGGYIQITKNQRIPPFGSLAERTIGYERKNAKSIGLEGAFNSYLQGSKTAVSYRKVSGGQWVPMFDDVPSDIENGKDVVTTLDINLQDVVHTALLRNMEQHNAKYGCAIVMEVKTGKIKAISNLERGENNNYYEKYNHAVATKTEPGSTFKVATLTALLDEGFIDENTKVDIEGGKKKYHNKWMHDDKYYPLDSITATKVMEVSSNVGISKLAIAHYGSNPSAFIDKLRAMRLTEPTGIEIEGESVPIIKKPGDSDWSGISLPWMAIGYEVLLTPLQMLTFYNAIANDGVMMKPYLVKEVRDIDRTIIKFEPEILNKNICKKNTAVAVRRILKSVLESGTAKKLHSDDFSVAAKTGTALIAKDNSGYQKNYQASIAGFFPAENPVYSCIVVINSPSEGGYYGAEVAGPVFKEIIEKYYSTNTATHEPINVDAEGKPLKNNKLKGVLPVAYNGNQYDIQNVYNRIGVSNSPAKGSDWAVVERHSQSVELMPIRTLKNIIPNVYGMGLKDAMYLLESNGLKVKFDGRGKVVKQVPMYGTPFKKGEIVVLSLN